jgi:hypothetical protein
MTQMAELTTQPMPRGRQTKFTPERLQQIRNLVERGKSLEEIAELVGTTVGSLQVTCSRLGVSLRRPIFDTGTGLRRRGRPRSNNETAVSSRGSSVPLQPTMEQPKPTEMSRSLLNIEKRSLPRLMLSGVGLASKDAV